MISNTFYKKELADFNIDYCGSHLWNDVLHYETILMTSIHTATNWQKKKISVQDKYPANMFLNRQFSVPALLLHFPYFSL